MVASGAAALVVQSHPTPRIPAAFAERRAAAHKGLADDSWRIVAAATDMADRFRRGGSLLAFGCGLAASDAQHVAVEFVHPVIVGKRALPAFALTGGLVAGGATDTGLDDRVRHLATADDIAVALSPGTGSSTILRGVEAAADLGLLTVALLAAGDDAIASSRAVHHALVVPTEDPCLAKELHVTIYHLLWELVHVLLEQGPAGPSGGAGSSGAGR